MQNSKKTVLITGAGGFVGGHIAKLFDNNGWKVTAIVHKNIPKELYQLPNTKLLQCDITKPYEISALPKTDILVHSAGLVSDIGCDELFKKLNFETVKNLAPLAKSKFIYISTTDVYGIKDFNGEDESALHFEQKIINPYQKYKIQSEKWIKNNLPSNKYVILRPGAIYGEGDETLESRFTDFLDHSPFIIHFGKWRGKNRWPLTNVENVAKAAYYTSLSDDFNGEAITIIDENKISIDDFYQIIAKKHFPDKRYKTICLPLWSGLTIGSLSTFLSNLLRLKKPIFDPTAYAIKHISSNLDFSCNRLKTLFEKAQNKN